MKVNSFQTGRGFTLVELLVVMLVIAVIANFVVPAVVGLMTSSNLTQSTELVVGQLNYARQVALSENKAVEVRLYKYSDANQPGSGMALRAMQLWKSNSDGVWEPVDRLYRFRGRIIISSGTLATAIGPDLTPSPTDTVKSLPAGYTFKAFQYRADGSTTLISSQANYFTLINENDPVIAPVNLPANFSTVQIEPFTGTVKVSRP